MGLDNVDRGKFFSFCVVCLSDNRKEISTNDVVNAGLCNSHYIQYLEQRLEYYEAKDD